MGILKIELIPKNSWFKNLRNSISKSKWDDIRKDVYKKADYRCDLCKSNGKLYCHEIWKYNDIKNIQKLIGFQALCENCHYLNHLGLVNVKIAKKELPGDFINTLIKHFCEVNNCNEKDFEKERNEAYRKWTERSKKHFYIDLKLWKDILDKKQLTLSNNYKEKCLSWKQ